MLAAAPIDIILGVLFGGLLLLWVLTKVVNALAANDDDDDAEGGESK